MRRGNCTRGNARGEVCYIDRIILNVLLVPSMLADIALLTNQGAGLTTTHAQNLKEGIVLFDTVSYLVHGL